jgi:Ca2+-binding EF-hand superfamily protein
MLRNMAASLVQYEMIQTTDAKAKELRRHADKLITLGKRGTLHARRQAFAILQDKKLVSKVFEDLPEEEFDNIFASVGAEDTGVLDLADFILGVMDKKELLGSENLRKAFSVFDKNGSGYMKTAELKTLLKFDKSLDAEAINEIAAHVDEEEDGEIAIEEFISAALTPKSKPKIESKDSDSAPDEPSKTGSELSVSIKFNVNNFVAHRLGQLTEHYEIIDYIAKGSAHQRAAV